MAAEISRVFVKQGIYCNIWLSNWDINEYEADHRILALYKETKISKSSINLLQETAVKVKVKSLSPSDSLRPHGQ